VSQNLTFKQRKNLEAKMAEIFKENLKELSDDFKEILLDDLVTAFQNRINVLIRVQKKRGN